MKRLCRWTLFLTPILLLAACAPLQPARTELAVAELSPSPVRILRADAWRRDGGLLVTGKVRRMHAPALTGHVDVILEWPDGLREQKAVAVPGLSSRRKGAMNLPFRARFDRTPAPASILVFYHPPASTSACVSGQP